MHAVDDDHDDEVMWSHDGVFPCTAVRRWKDSVGHTADAGFIRQL